MGSYSSIHNHRSMIFDDLRNSYYFNAIKSVVNKDSIVLDLGAGLGLHGLMALGADAKKVYLVEPASIINTTRMIIKSNNLSDKIECIEGKIEEVTLPEKVDVITSVFTGNFLLSEDLLPSLFYARDKFLNLDGKLIPDRAKMIAVPVSVPEYYAKHIDCWSEHLQNIDFSLVRKFAANSIYSDKPKKRQTEFLSKPVKILELDFMKATEAACRTHIDVEIFQDGELHGWLGWFDARVGDTWLSTSPKGAQMHWSQVFLPLEEPINVKKGDKVSFELNRPEFGEWSWIIEAEGKRQKHSTFLSGPVSPLKVMKKSDTYKPIVSEKGMITQKILELFNGGLSTANIVVKIEEDYRTFFSTHTVADQFVKNLVEQYT